jgi:hypothetical protein
LVGRGVPGGLIQAAAQNDSAVYKQSLPPSPFLKLFSRIWGEFFICAPQHPSPNHLTTPRLHLYRHSAQITVPRGFRSFILEIVRSRLNQVSGCLPVLLRPDSLWTVATTSAHRTITPQL